MCKLNYKKLITLISLTIILISFQLSCFSIGDHQTVSQPIVIYGDSRTGHQTHQNIVDEIIKTKPALVFHTGDLVEDGLIPDQWATFNEIISDLIKISDFYPALGNHENNSPLFFNNFILPNNERWYSVEKDNLHFMVYNQARTSPYSQLFIKAYHFCKLFLINNQLIIEVYDINSNLIDRFVID